LKRYCIYIFTVLTVLLSLQAQKAVGQQGRGIFFSVFGQNAPETFGDIDNRQAFYLDIPESETAPVYLRVFDADVGGRYEEKRGNYDTQTRFIVLGGESADKKYYRNPGFSEKQVNFNNADIIISRQIGYDKSLDASYISLGELPPDKGFRTEDGYRRYVLLVEGMGGNDGNYFDFVLSYDPNRKDIPKNIRLFVYDLTLRIPDWPDFIGKIPIRTQNNTRVTISTFDMDDVPISIEQIFKADSPLETSGDGVWHTNTYHVDNPTLTREIGLIIEGKDFNNSFGLIAQDSAGEALPIPLPITDYEPPKEPVITHEVSFTDNRCEKAAFKADILNSSNFDLERITWVFSDDTLSGSPITKSFSTPGYQIYELKVEGYTGGQLTDYHIIDSLLINVPPAAWAGGNRVHVPDLPMAFDGTVSEDPDGFITEYFWDFGDNSSASGARVDHTYEEYGIYTVTLKVVDNSSVPCNTATASARVKINKPPVAKVNIPQFSQIGQVIELDATASEDPDGTITSYEWSIGNDTTLYGPSVKYAFNEKDTPVSLKITDDSKVKNSAMEKKFSVNVNLLPLARAGENKKTSPGTSILFDGTNSSDPDGRISRYEWDFGSYQTEGPTVRYAFQEPGKYPVTLTVTDDSGISTASDTITVNVNAPPIPMIAGDMIYATGRVILSAEDSYDPDGTITAYNWNMGDGNTKKGTKIGHTYKKPGKYTVALTVKDDSDTDSAIRQRTSEVIINHFPEAHIKMPEIAAPYDTLTFSGGQSFDPDGEIISYNWDFGDNESGVGKTVRHSFLKPGTYQIQLEVRDDSGLPQAADITNKTLTINHPPNIVVDFPGKIDPDSTITFDASESFDPDGKITTIYWNYDGTWHQGKKILKIKGNELKNGIKVAMEDDANVKNSRVEQKLSAEVNESPVAIAGEDKHTDKMTIVFDGSESYDPDGDDIQHYWDFSDGGSGRGAIISHTYRHGGRYKAILTVDDQRLLSNSFDSDTVEVFINRPPDAFFELPYAVCVEDTFRYDGSNSFDIDGNENLRYDWTFGDGNTAQSKTGLHRYEKTGTYQVELTVDDTEGFSNSTDTFVQPIQVVGAPTADAGSNIQACEMEPVQFDGSNSLAAEGMLNQYTWDFGDGNTGSGVAPVHRYSEPGTYQVKLTITGNDYGSCDHTDTDMMTITVLPKPEAEFDTPEFLLEGEPLVLDASPSLQPEVQLRSFKWEITGPDTININWFQRTYTDSTERRIAEWVSRGSKITAPQVIEDQSLTGQLPKTVLEDLPPGNYQVKLMIETNSMTGCNTAVASRFVDIRQREELQIADIPVLVPHKEFNFKLNSIFINPENYEKLEWHFGDGTTNEGINVKHAYTEPGIYTLEFKADDGRGSKYSVTELEQKVMVNAAPIATISGPSRVTPNTPVTFDATASRDPDGSITSYNWFFSDGTRKTGPRIEHSFNRSGSFAVSLTVRDNREVSNSVDTDNTIVLVAPPPDITMKMPNAVCPGVPINFIDALSVNPEDSSLVNIKIGEKKISYGQAANHEFNVPGKYRLTIELEDGSGNNRETIRQTIIVNGSPEIYAEVPRKTTIGAANEMVRMDASNSFDPNGDILNYYWDLGDGTQQVGKTIQHQYQRSGIYTVLLTVMDDKGMKCSVAEKKYEIQVTER